MIYHLETYDITTIRAGTPMFLLARKVKAMGIKMVMSGEGADETLAGYLYFHKAPNGTELHEECVRKVGDLAFYDCLRANKATMAHGLEVRVPFLDKEMLDVTMLTDPDYKLRKAGAPTQFVEKWLLRGPLGAWLHPAPTRAYFTPPPTHIHTHTPTHTTIKSIPIPYPYPDPAHLTLH